MRLFLGIEIPETLRREVIEQIDRSRTDFPPARWVRADNLHMTLVFIGEVGEEDLSKIEDAMTGLFARWGPMELSLRESRSFPPGRGARVLWIGLQTPDSLADLQRAAVSSLLHVVDLSDEGREFHPHLTVARARPAWSRQATAAWQEVVIGKLGSSFVVEQGTLFSSRLTPDGARYTRLCHFPLAGTA